METMVTEEEMAAVWGYANFGPEPRIDTVKYATLKHASGYCTGHTAKLICQQLGLITRHEPPKLTRRGKFCLWEWFGKKGF